jgi:large subunit GTPase 1
MPSSNGEGVWLSVYPAPLDYAMYFDLSRLQDRDKFLLTPFEKNIEVWRQLWRVLERSHLVVQIVDARNPLNFRCEDLESYVLDVEGPEGEQGTGSGLRRNLLLINKSDLLTSKQR